MKVLVGCEESQEVCKAFRRLGHEAYSCDIQDCSGGHPEWHLKMDVFDAIASRKWDVGIFFPSCTYLASSGLHWNKKRPERQLKTENALQFIRDLMDACIDRIAIENPVGCISSRIRKPDQIIEPWMFGDLASKKTCLWLKNLPNLVPDISEKPELEYVKYGKNNRMQKWMYDIRCTTIKNGKRAVLASKTFPGIAKAMARQWGGKLQNNLEGNTNLRQIQ